MTVSDNDYTERQQNLNTFLNTDYSNLKVNKQGKFEKLNPIDTLIYSFKKRISSKYKDKHTARLKEAVTPLLNHIKKLKKDDVQIGGNALVDRVAALPNKIFSRKELAKDRELVNILSSDIAEDRQTKFDKYLDSNWVDTVRASFMERSGDSRAFDELLLNDSLDLLDTIPVGGSLFFNDDISDIVKMNLSDEDKEIINSHNPESDQDTKDLNKLSDTGKEKIQAFYHRRLMAKLDSLPDKNIFGINDNDYKAFKFVIKDLVRDDKALQFARKTNKAQFAMKMGYKPKDIGGGLMGTKIMLWFNDKNLVVLKGLHDADSKSYNPGLINRITWAGKRIFGGQLHYLSNSSHFESQGEVATKVANDFMNTGISPGVDIVGFEDSKGKEYKGMVMAFLGGYYDADKVADPEKLAKIEIKEGIKGEFDVPLEKWPTESLSMGKLLNLKNQVTGKNAKATNIKFNEDFQKLTLLDFVTGNLDRKGDNWMVSPKKRMLTVIDNANSFPQKSFKKSKITIGQGFENTYLWREFNLSHVPYTQEIKDFVLESMVLDKLADPDLDLKDDDNGAISSLVVDLNNSNSIDDKLEVLRIKLQNAETLNSVASFIKDLMVMNVDKKLEEKKLPPLLNHDKAKELLEKRIYLALSIGANIGGIKSPYDLSQMVYKEDINKQIETTHSNVDELPAE